QGRRSTRPAVGESSVGYQSQDRKNARPDLPASVAWSRRRGDRMRRREFILALGGAAASWPLAARAQQALPAIGFLHEGLPAPLSLTTAFQQGLIEAGVSAGSSLRIENRWAEGQYDRLPALAADLIEHRVGIIVAVYLVAARAAKAATQTVPI